MNMANIGIGVGAFADGFTRGVGLGQGIKKVRNQKEIETIQREGLQAARAEREQAIDSNITSEPSIASRSGIGMKEADPNDPMTQFLSREQFKVGDQTFDSRDAAREAASKNAPSEMDIFMTKYAPKVQAAYVAQGDIQRAEGWNQWIKQSKTQKSIKETMGILQAAKSGDFDTAAKRIGKWYNDNIDDGSTYQGHEMLKDADGNTTGLVVSIKGTNGKVTKMPLQPRDMMEMFMSEANPEKMFEIQYKQYLQADQMRAEDAKEARKYNREQQGRIDLETIKAQLQDAGSRREFDRKVALLRQAGYTDDFVNRVMPELLGIDSSGPYKKGASPEEQARLLLQERMKDFRFSRMSPDEQKATIQRDMQMLQDIARTITPQASAGGTMPQQPAAGGMPLLMPDGTVTTR